MVTIDADRAIALLREIVEGNEDFIYHIPVGLDHCVYVDKGEPSCLVGQALSRAGVSIEILSAMDESDFAAIRTNDHPHLSEILIWGARRVFASAQDVQDSGKPWGNALEAAEGAYKRVSE